MTESRKTILMIIFATVLAVGALAYGFSVIPSPEQQRNLKLDHRRVSDLGELQYSIDEHYRNTTKLPSSLKELKNVSYYSARGLTQSDPETQKPYEYSILDDKKYQLCATFTTDSEKEISYYDNENYNYSSFKDKFKHPIGRHCFVFDVPLTYDQPTTFTPAVNVMPISAGTQGAIQVLPPKR